MFTPEEAKAKKLLLTIFVLFLFLDGVMVLYTQEYLTGIVRLLLTGLLMYFVMQGHKWAKWLTIVFCGISALLVLFFAVYIASNSVSVASVLILFGFGFSSMSIYLIKNKNINKYFETVGG